MTIKYSLNEGYRETEQAFIKSANISIVQDTLNKFRILVQKNKITGDEKNIDWWAKQGWDKFKRFVDINSQVPTQTELKRKKLVGNSIPLIENDNWLIVIPLDSNASCFHGKNTKWCISKPFKLHFHEYFIINKSTFVFCINKQRNERWAIAYIDIHPADIGPGYIAKNILFYDKNDVEITEDTFESQTGLDSTYIFELVTTKQHINKINTHRKTMISNFDNIETSVKSFIHQAKSHSFETDRNIEIETMLLNTQNAHALNMYVNTMFNRWGFQKYGPVFERLIVSLQPNLIFAIKNPSTQVKKDALDSSQGLVISHMLEYSDTIQVSRQEILYAVQLNGENIKYVLSHAPDLRNDKEIIFTALDRHPRAIYYFKNPTDDEIDYALSKNYFSIWDIPANRITDDRIIFAIQSHVSNISSNDVIWQSVARFLARGKGIKLSDNVLSWMIENLDNGFAVIVKLKMDGKLDDISPKIINLLYKHNPEATKLLFPDIIDNIPTTITESKQKLLEWRKGKISHPEDLIWEAGYEGYKTAIAALDYAQRNPSRIQVKWDGSPAIIFGRDPVTGELIVTDKSGFGAKKYNGLAKSQKQLFDMIYNRNPSTERKHYASMFASLWPLFERAVPHDVRGFYHCDLMYAGIPEIKNEAYQFQQNKIIYRVPINSNLGKKIANSRAGIVVHGFYKDINQSSPDAVYDTAHLAKFPGLLVMPPISISNSIKPVKISINSKFRYIDNLFNPIVLKQEKISDLKSIIGKYVNQMAVNGNADYSDAMNKFIEWLPISGVHGQKQTRIINHIKNNTKAFWLIWHAISNVTKIKSHIKQRLDLIQHSDIHPYLQNKQMHEGYVVETPYGLIKLVDRNLFMAKETTNPKFLK